MPVKSPGSATMTRLTSVPPSLEAQTAWLDWVKGVVVLSADALGAGAGACAVVSAQQPTKSKVKIHTFGMSSLQTCRKPFLMLAGAHDVRQRKVVGDVAHEQEIRPSVLLCC